MDNIFKPSFFQRIVLNSLLVIVKDLFEIRQRLRGTLIVSDDHSYIMWHRLQRYCDSYNNNGYIKEDF